MGIFPSGKFPSASIVGRHNDENQKDGIEKGDGERIERLLEAAKVFGRNDIRQAEVPVRDASRLLPPAPPSPGQRRQRRA
jgi:hypothetical protein